MTFTEGADKVFKKTCQRGFNKNLFGYDIETYGTKNLFQCACVWCINGEGWFFTDEKKLVEFFCSKRFRNAWVCATNLDFDFTKVFEKQKCYLQFKRFQPKNKLIYTKSFIQNDDEGNFYFQIDNPKKKSGRSITFVDTTNYDFVSVETLGKIIGVPKMDMPFPIGYKCKNKEEFAKMKEYCMNDAKISCMYMDFLNKTFSKVGANLNYTIASSSMSLYRNVFMGDEEIPLEDPLVSERIMKAYRGGRTETLMRGYSDDEVYCNDINSMYPAVMCEKLPYPPSRKISRQNNLKYIIKYEGVSEVTILCPDMKYPLLGTVVDGKFIFGTGRITDSWTHVELRYAMKLGYIIEKVYETIYYTQTYKPFKKFVDCMYSLRDKFKSENNPAEHIIKILMNSLYGKFGQRNDSHFEYVSCEDENLEQMMINNPDNCPLGNLVRFNLKGGEPSIFQIPIFPCYITSLARIKLHEYMMKAVEMGFPPIYVDTDSIFCKGIIEDSKELGKMKCEYKSRQQVFVKPKMYQLDYYDEKKKSWCEKVKIKGLQKDILGFGKIDYKFQIPIEQLGKTKMDKKNFFNLLNNPQVWYSKMAKFLEAKRGKMEIGENILREKKFDLEDSKRDWLGNKFKLDKMYDSIPIKLNIEEPTIKTTLIEDETIDIDSIITMI